VGRGLLPIGVICHGPWAVVSRRGGSGRDGPLRATIVDAVDGPDPFAFGDAEFTALLCEFTIDAAKYLRPPHSTRVTANGRPGGIWMYGRFLSEPKLLAFAYDLEQEIGGRPLRGYLGALPPLPPDAGICPVPLAARTLTPAPAALRRLPAGRMPRL